MSQPLQVLIWHVHGSYLYYLTHSRNNFYVPFKPDRSKDYSGKFGHIPWPANVIDVPVEEVKRLNLDCIIFQLPHQYLEDQFVILSADQRRLPKIYLQHDPPQGHPTNMRHIVDDPDMLLIHVTPFNALMWDSGRTPTRVIDHGVKVPEKVHYTGEIPKGITAVNHLERRGRIVGADVFSRARRHVPLDLVGMAASETEGGLYEVRHDMLMEFESHYRFFFNPIRYTSLGLAVCEAMMIGMPIIGLATTEMATAIKNGSSGYVETDEEKMIDHMRRLITNPDEAMELGRGAKMYAQERFDIHRFVDDWDNTLEEYVG